MSITKKYTYKDLIIIINEIRGNSLVYYGKINMEWLYNVDLFFTMGVFLTNALIL